MYLVFMGKKLVFGDVFGALLCKTRNCCIKAGPARTISCTIFITIEYAFSILPGTLAPLTANSLLFFLQV